MEQPDTTSLISRLAESLENIGLSASQAVFAKTVIVILSIILLSILADFLAKRIIVETIKKVVKRSKSKRDDIFIQRKVFNRLAHLVPALIIFFTAELAIGEYPKMVALIQAITRIYIILMLLLFFDAFLSALHDIYKTLPISSNRPIKGYVQVVKIFIVSIGVVLILSIILNKKPDVLLAGLGAVAAVLLLVFKDTILGFVASIQISANNMVKPGDWIEMPSRGADGTVTEITLNTVKVSNWDKTIATIPTYALVSESFTNWKGMEESGGRRIKRSINIDMKSVKFADEQLINKFKRIQVLRDYIDKKLIELDHYNKEHNIDESVKVNGRRITNLGTFRKYIEEYLKRHPLIHNDMTFLVRHLQPTEKGLPIEIYVFSKEQAWARYESLQADIFDHILSVIPEFDLRVFQNPTGDDFRKLAR